MIREADAVISGRPRFDLGDNDRHAADFVRVDPKDCPPNTHVGVDPTLPQAVIDKSFAARSPTVTATNAGPRPPAWRREKEV